MGLLRRCRSCRLGLGVRVVGRWMEGREVGSRVGMSFWWMREVANGGVGANGWEELRAIELITMVEVSDPCPSNLVLYR